MILRRKRSENKSSNGRTTPDPLQLEDLGSSATDTTSSSVNLVYQNLVDIRPSEEGMVLLAGPVYRLYQNTCQVDPFFEIQWNPDFTNLQGKRKLVRKIE